MIFNRWNRWGIRRATQRPAEVLPLPGSVIVECCLDIQYGSLGIGAIKRFNSSQIVGFDILPESAAILLNRQGWSIFHMLEQYVENVPDLVDELVEVVIERSVISSDDSQFGVIFEKYKTCKMHDLELVEGYPDRILFRRGRLDLVDTGTEGFEVLR